MNSKDWKNIIRTVAPGLGALLGGPLAGTAVGVLTETLLGDKDAGEAKLQEFINKGLTPEQLVVIKKADQDFIIRTKELDFKWEELEVLDRSSARDREKVIGRWATIGVHTIGVVILGGFFATVFFVLTEPVTPDDNKLMLVGALVGYVSAKADQVVAYFFGSSVGSKQKTSAMADALDKSVSNSK